MVAATLPDIKNETVIEVADVVARFKVCRRTVENWFAAGLEGFKLRGRVYTTIEAVVRFAEPVSYERHEIRHRASSASTELQAYEVSRGRA